MLKDKNIYLNDLFSDYECGSRCFLFCWTKPCEIRVVMLTLDVSWVDREVKDKAAACRIYH